MGKGGISGYVSGVSDIISASVRGSYGEINTAGMYRVQAFGLYRRG